MEIKATLKKPFTELERINFVVGQNHKLGYEIKETETALEAWGLTQEEVKEKEDEKIKKFSLTRGDVFRALFQARKITRAQLRELIEKNVSSEVEREIALIDFDEALNFYRGNVLIDVVGGILGISKEQLDKFFETNDFTHLLPIEE